MNNNEKIRRFTAYCLDLLIITLIAFGLFKINFLHPNADKYETAYSDYQDYITKVNEAGNKDVKKEGTIIGYFDESLDEEETKELKETITKIKTVSNVKTVSKDDIKDDEKDLILKEVNSYFELNDGVKAFIISIDDDSKAEDVIKKVKSQDGIKEVNEYTEDDEEQIKAVADMTDKERDEYLEKTGKMLRKVNYYGISYNVCWIVVIILYFTLFPYFNNGMTIGKRVVKLKMVRSDDSKKKVSLWQYFVKAILCPIYGTGMLSNALTFVVMIVTPLMLDGTTYAYATSYISLGLCVLCYIEVFMIAFKKDSLGFSDKLARVKVVDYVRD